MDDLKSPLHTIDLTGKRILLRADLNVPLSDGSIVSDLRLRAMLPTVNAILDKGGKIILMTHIGRPRNQEATLSTKILLPWFTQQGYSCIFENNLNNAYSKSFGDPKTILLLENLRFYPGEQQNDPLFAQSLARLGDIYINDAFGSLHRTDCSVIDVPRLFAPHKRMFGLLIEREINQINAILRKPVRPFVLIVGGNKIKDKIPLIIHLLKKIDTLILCPPLVFTYVACHDKPIGKSCITAESLELCKQLSHLAQSRALPILIPIDYVVSTTDFFGVYTVKKAEHLSDNDYVISIGPETEKTFSEAIKQSHTCFYNGLMGSPSFPESLHGVKAIFNAMAESQGSSIIGGGDSIAAAQKLGFSDRISLLSTGGGALMAYLSGHHLATLDLLINK